MPGSSRHLLEPLPPSPAEQQERLQQLQSRFGYPITLSDSDQLTLSPSEQEQLNSLLIVVKNNGSLFYRLIPASNKVITMGPINDLDLSLQIDLLAWAMITLLFGLMAILWARPLWLKLKEISRAAQAFGQGDFSARANLPHRSTLAPLAETFNNMAGRIQQLIASHKELTRAISHELRTPISRIRFSLEMAQSAREEAKRQNYLGEISRDVDELEDLVSELLSYARFDRETPALHKEEQLMAPWLVLVVKEIKPVLARATVSCLISEEAEAITACIAPRYMARAVSNLIINAGKYSESRIIVRLEKGENRCLIHIDDDGPGIPMVDRERIFEPFIRLDASRTKDTGGHGLGLAIVKQIITLHGGTVSVESSPLGGARFTLNW